MSLSYVDLAVEVTEADDYADARLWSDWTGDEATKTAALRRAQDFIASTYNDQWSDDDWDDTDAPDEVRYAIIEGARRELVSPGSLSPDVTMGKVKTRVRVEGAVDVTYASGNASAQRPDISIIRNLLAPLLSNGGATVDLLRI